MKFVGQVHRTLIDEHFRVIGQMKLYESIEEM